MLDVDAIVMMSAISASDKQLQMGVRLCDDATEPAAERLR